MPAAAAILYTYIRFHMWGNDGSISNSHYKIFLILHLIHQYALSFEGVISSC